MCNAVGRTYLVPPVARAAVAAGADGLLIEVHVGAEEAISEARNRFAPRFLRL